MKVLVVMTAVLLLLTSCVKEERTDCPCYLTLNFDKVIAERIYGEAVTTLTPCEHGNTDRKLIVLSDYEKVGYETKVRRKNVRVSVVCGYKNNIFGEDCLLTAEDMQADPVMAYAGSTLCDADCAEMEVTLHKQYCRISFLYDGMESGEEFPNRVRVSAECNGMNLYDLMPLTGGFSAEAAYDPSGELCLILPRQNRNAISVDVMSVDDELLYRMDLGLAFSSVGYDWTKEDLDDVSIRIDYSKPEIEMEIIPWETYYETFDI